MKKLLTIPALILVLLLASCTASSPAPQASGSGNSNIACPEKEELSPEMQALADRYYEELKDNYPEFYAIPRELLSEYVCSDDYLTVAFGFCLGGYATEYNCEFSTSPAYPDGHWDMFGEEFSPFSNCVLTADEVAEIKTMLFDSISAYIGEYRLDPRELSAETVRLTWNVIDGKLYACTEEIAAVTDETTREFGCGDHAHVFGKVLVEFTEGGAVLTDMGASGS